MGSYRRLFIILALIFFLSGCVSVKNPPIQGRFAVLPRETRAQILQKLKFWGADGAFSIQFGDKQRPVLANYTWRELGYNESRIRISSALDLFNVVIFRRLGSVTLWRNEREHFTASSAQQLMQRILGWSLPVENMIYWMKGAPAPGKSSREYDEYGHITTLEQQGWVIRYASYKTVHGIDLPNVIYMQRPGLRLKIVMRRWHLFMRYYHIQSWQDWETYPTNMPATL